MSIALTAGRSPFDAIRQIGANGTDEWSARDLQPVMGYGNWDRFEDAIDRAKMACVNSGFNPSDHFHGTEKVIKGGRWGQQSVSDYRLTRYAAYLVAMNGDSRKPEIAAAQTYFAVQTHIAETIGAAPAEVVLHDLDALARLNEAFGNAIALARQEQERADLAEGKVAELEPKAAAAEVYLSASGGHRLVREAAKELGLTQKDLRAFLLEEKFIFRIWAGCGDEMYDFYAAHKAHFTAGETVVQHRSGACVHYTVRITKAGMVAILQRIQKRQQEMRAAIENVQQPALT